MKTTVFCSLLTRVNSRSIVLTTLAVCTFCVTGGAHAALVTHYDAAVLGLAGDRVTRFIDRSGNSNDAAAVVGRIPGRLVENGIGRRPSVRFEGEGSNVSGTGTGYRSVRSLGNFGIRGNEPWTMMAVLRLSEQTVANFAHVASLGVTPAPNAGALIELQRIDDRGNLRLDLATHFANDVTVEGPQDYFRRLELRDIILTVTHAGLDGNAIFDNIDFFVNGFPLGTSFLTNLEKGVTGNVASAELALQDGPLHLGGARENVTNAGFDGLLAEFLIFDEALAGNERLSIERALGEKYGIPTNPVPIPPALWLLGSALVGLGLRARQKRPDGGVT